MNTPRVSVILVNYNGARHLAECLASLNALDWPAAALDVILVDNASTDDSLAVARALRSDIQVLPQAANLGFAPACNLGARAASGEYLAFLNNDLRVDPGWLRAMTAPFVGAPADLACVASVIRSWDGRLVDFVGGALNAYGRAFQVDQGLPYDPDRYAAPRELLFACGGAMLARREVYLETGGFDDDFIAYFEDVDFGWRLWLQGYRVVLAPAAQAFHRLHATGARLGAERRFAISELNALRMLVKNAADEHVYRLLSVSLLLGAKRAELHGQLRRDDYAFPGPLDARPAATTEVSRLALAYVMAQSRLADELPEWLAKRARIQARRRRSDQELFTRFPLALANPLFPWRRHAVLHEQALHAVNFSPMPPPHPPPHLLILSHETIGPKMAGPGVRNLEVARALAA
ncbi:MAG: glycosyltransferase family 2 protein, partial [Anaerolineales bacterium]|nr:glycosyltransferase family 2 protein [Anaerolineales bacterium]